MACTVYNTDSTLTHDSLKTLFEDERVCKEVGHVRLSSRLWVCLFMSLCLCTCTFMHECVLILFVNYIFSTNLHDTEGMNIGNF